MLFSMGQKNLCKKQKAIYSVISVCMNAPISTNLRARDMKFLMHFPVYHGQSVIIFNTSYASRNLYFTLSKNLFIVLELFALV